MADSNKQKKKKVGTAVAAIVAASAVAVGSAFGDADEIFDTAPDSIIEVMDAEEDSSPDDEENTEKGRRGGQSLRARRLTWPQAIRSAILLPLWYLGRGILYALSSLFTILQEPLLRAVLNLALIAAAAVGIFKVLHPDEPLKNLLKKKRILPMLALWLLLCGADILLPMVSEEAELWIGITGYAIKLLIPVGIYFALRGRRKKRKTVTAQ